MSTAQTAALYGCLAMTLKCRSRTRRNAGPGLWLVAGALRLAGESCLQAMIDYLHWKAEPAAVMAPPAFVRPYGKLAPLFVMLLAISAIPLSMA